MGPISVLLMLVPMLDSRIGVECLQRELGISPETVITDQSSGEAQPVAVRTQPQFLILI